MIRDLIEKEYSNILGIQLLHNGKSIVEECFNNYNSRKPLHITSITKSILSIITGIAIDYGFINSVDQKILDFFPDYKIKRGEKCIQNITLENIITMTAPYKWRSEPYSKVFSSDDWVKNSLDLLGTGRSDQKIGDFKYSTVCLQILSGVIEYATGKTIRGFSEEYLFTPLGITTPESKAITCKDDYMDFIYGRSKGGWIQDPKGVNSAGWGLSLSLVDLLKIGELYRQDGKFYGKRIISKKWIEESTKKHSALDDKSYGYLWWILEENNKFAAIGDGGNLIYADKKRSITAVVVSSFKPRYKDRIELIEKLVDEVL